MSAVYPAQEHKILAFTPDGKAFVQHQTHETRLAITYEDGSEEMTESVLGGYGRWTSEETDILRRDERRILTSFLKFKRTYERTKIPIEREAIKTKMLQKFGTLDYETLQNRLKVEAMADPRLDVKTRKGVIKTTVKGQDEWAHEKDETVKPKEQAPTCRHCLKPMDETPAAFCGSPEHLSAARNASECEGVKR